MGWLALRWLWCSLILYPRTLGWVQTEWQQQLLQQVNETALSMSKQGRQQLLERLDRADVRTLLASCCPERAQLPAEALAHELRQALLAAEVVSGFSTEVNRSFFSFSLSEAEEVDHYENLWEIWVRNHADFSNYSYGMDWVETAFFGFKYFQHHAHPLGMEEARERSPYFLLNSLQVDAGSPLYGDVTVVLKPSFAHATAVISPFDSGSWAGFCNRSFETPKVSYSHNCSAYPGHQGLGTFQAFDHLFGINEAYWAKSTAFLQPLAQLLASDHHDIPVTGEDFVRYFEVLPTAKVQFADVKFVIADFPSLFGTARGVRVRSWCQRNGWLLLWSLGLNVGFSTDHGMPHFWDVFNMTGPFKNKQRLIDPYFLRLDPWRMSISTSDLDTFNASWWLLKRKRRISSLQPSDFHLAWTAMLANLSADLQIAPVRAYCHDLDGCVGVTRHGCLCKPTESLANSTPTVIIWCKDGKTSPKRCKKWINSELIPYHCVHRCLFCGLAF